MFGQIFQFAVTAVGLAATLLAATPKGYRAIRDACRWAKRHVLNDGLERRVDGLEAELHSHENDRALHQRQPPQGRRR